MRGVRGDGQAAAPGAAFGATKCGDGGAPSVRKVDGCERCYNCCFVGVRLTIGKHRSAAAGHSRSRYTREE
jgi:hypothetical protein